MRRGIRDGLVVFWCKLRRRATNAPFRGYRCMRRMSSRELRALIKYVPKPYKEAKFPGEKVQNRRQSRPEILYPREARARAPPLPVYRH